MFLNLGAMYLTSDRFPTCWVSSYQSTQKTDRIVCVCMVSYYTQQDMREVGIGNVISFGTEQHHKKRENQVGMLTLRVVKHSSTPEGAATAENMLIKCCNVGPILRGTIAKEHSVVSRHQDALHKHINAYLCRHYQGAPVGGSLPVMTRLSDSLYVLAVQVAAADEPALSSKFSPWDGGKGGASTRTVTTSAAAGGGRDAGGSGINSRTTNSSISSTVHIKFCRVEDVPVIMQACRVFFRQVESSGGRMQVEFPRGEMPMWWRILHDAPFDFKKTRDEFRNEEVVEQFRERSGCHFSTCFTLDVADVLLSTRLRAANASSGWIPVVYVDAAKLVLCESHEVRARGSIHAPDADGVSLA